jgi:predicted acetyltransferase
MILRRKATRLEIAVHALAAPVVQKNKRIGLLMNITIYDTINKIYGEEKVNHAKEDIYRLWQECFGDSKEYTDFYFKWKVKDNQILTIYKKDSLCSMLHLNPYMLSIREQQVPVNYIVGVATKMEERRQGLMKLLLERALHQMYLEKMPLTYLMPAAEAIYSPYDFRVVYEQEPWNKIMKATINNIGEPHNGVLNCKNIRVKSLRADDKVSIEELTTFCNGILSQEYDIYVNRTPYYYERLIQEMESGFGEVLVCYKDNQIIGYVSYMAEDMIYITEMITGLNDKEAVLHVLGAYYEKNIKKQMYEDKEHKITTIMVRIVDFRSFVKAFTVEEEMHITMKVVDDIIQENNGIYHLNFTKDGCQITTTTKEPEITLSIADVASIFFGRLKIDDIIKQDGTSSSCNKETIDKLYKINKLTKVFINDVV